MYGNVKSTFTEISYTKLLTFPWTRRALSSSGVTRPLSSAARARRRSRRQFERKALGAGPSSPGKLRQGRQAGASRCKDQPGDARGNDWHNAISGEFFHE